MSNNVLQEFLDRLIAFLCSIRALRDRDNRDYLLKGFPSGPRGALKRKDAYAGDLRMIVEAAASWGKIESGGYALEKVVNNALDFVRGTEQGERLQELKAGLMSNNVLQEFLDRLIAFLCSIRALRDRDNRDYLLKGFPSGPRGALKRKDAYAGDLRMIVEAAASWGKIESGGYALEKVVNNALDFVRGTEQGERLQELKYEFANLVRLEAVGLRELLPTEVYEEIATSQTWKVTARPRIVDFVLVTALDEELDAVLDRLPGYQQLPPFPEDIRTYFQADLPVTFSDGQTGVYQVVVMPLLGMGRVQSGMATADAIRRWHPRYIVLIGIAGGIADRGVRIGDILISDQIVDYELQKLTPQGPQIRWDVQRADPRLLGACKNFRGESWQELIRTSRPDPEKPKRHTGPIASGDKVIAFGEVLARYRDVWPKLIGVEMEAAGAATATFQSTEKPGFFMVRCVSDLADEQKDSGGVGKWRSYACEAAASFVIALLKSGPVPLPERSESGSVKPGQLPWK